MIRREKFERAARDRHLGAIEQTDRDATAGS